MFSAVVSMDARIGNLAHAAKVNVCPIHAGHVSKQMLKHYSHIRMEAKRRTVDSLTVKVKTAAAEAEKAPISFEVPQEVPTVEVVH